MKRGQLRKYGFLPERFRIAGYLAILVGCLFLYFEFSKPSIHLDKGLFFINGHFENYSFIKGFSGSRAYTFKIQEYSNSFKIKADFLGSNFKMEKFTKLQEGDPLRISIYERDISKLSSSNTIFVYSITDNREEYLNLNDTLEKHNGNFHYYAFSFFVLSGFGMLYFDKRVKKPEE